VHLGLIVGLEFDSRIPAIIGSRGYFAAYVERPLPRNRNVQRTSALPAPDKEHQHD
jgi:hypothetical protein